MKRFGCKGIFSRRDASTEKLDWSTAKASTLHAGESHFEVEKKTFFYTDIESAKIEIIPTVYFMKKCRISFTLKDGMTHHLQLFYSKFWDQKFPFPLTRKEVKISNLFLARLALIAVLAYLIYIIVK